MLVNYLETLLRALLPTDNTKEVNNEYKKYKSNGQAEKDYSTMKEKQKKPK